MEPPQEPIEETLEELPKEQIYRVLYDVSCIKCKIMYTNPSGGTNHHEISGAWNLVFEVKTGQWLSVIAQNGHDGGEVHVAIYVDDKVLQTAASSGGGAIAKASGSIA